MINFSVKNMTLTGGGPVSSHLDHIHSYLDGLKIALETISTGEVERFVRILLASGLNGHTIFLCGNGGSAATASHMACDLAKGIRTEGFPSFRAISLTDSLPQLTAWANDTSYDNCFSGQLEGLGRPGDLLLAISGSGNSPNVLNAVEVARRLHMTTLGLAGFKGGKLKGLVDHCLVIPAANIEQVEDAHMALAHTITTTLRAILQERAALLLEPTA